nr:podocalyxin [Manis javanica]
MQARRQVSGPRQVEGVLLQRCLDDSASPARPLPPAAARALWGRGGAGGRRGRDGSRRSSRRTAAAQTPPATQQPAAPSPGSAPPAGCAAAAARRAAGAERALGATTSVPERRPRSRARPPRRAATCSRPEADTMSSALALAFALLLLLTLPRTGSNTVTNTSEPGQQATVTATSGKNVIQNSIQQSAMTTSNKTESASSSLIPVHSAEGVKDSSKTTPTPTTTQPNPHTTTSQDGAKAGSGSASGAQSSQSAITNTMVTKEKATQFSTLSYTTHSTPAVSSLLTPTSIHKLTTSSVALKPAEDTSKPPDSTTVSSSSGMAVGPTFASQKTATTQGKAGSPPDDKLVILLCRAAKANFNPAHDKCHIQLARIPETQAVAIKEITIKSVLLPKNMYELLKDKWDDLKEVGVSSMKFGDQEPPEETEDRFSMPLIITIVCMASFLLLVAALYGCCHQRLSQRKDQQRLTEELQTVENGYHDNPTLEVMETSSEMQEKKAVNLNGELGDSWIVPLDNLAKDDLDEEEDTHL